VIGLRGGVPHDGAPIQEEERRILNALVRRYLVEHKFKMTAVTFADEVRVMCGSVPFPGVTFWCRSLMTKRTSCLCKRC
jgi:hypothetical protein